MIRRCHFRVPVASTAVGTISSSLGKFYSLYHQPSQMLFNITRASSSSSSATSTVTIRSVDEDEVLDSESTAGYFSSATDDDDSFTGWLTPEDKKSPSSSPSSVSGQKTEAAAGEDVTNNNNNDDQAEEEEASELAIDGGARSLMMQELDETLNIPLTDRILSVGRNWINAAATSGGGGGGGAGAIAQRQSAMNDGALLQRNGFSTASAHLTRGGVLRVHYPMLMQDPGRDMLALCRAVARLHGSSLRQESDIRAIKLQQTAMPMFSEFLRDLATAKQQQQQARDDADVDVAHLTEAILNKSDSGGLTAADPEKQTSDQPDAKSLMFVSSADVIDEKVAIVTVVVFDGRQSSLEPGTELVYTTVALRLFWSAKQGSPHLLVPEPKS